MTIRILIADDQPEVREGMSMLLDAEPDLECIAAVGDGTEAVAVALRERPDVVLMDIRMPGIDGIEATRRITHDTEGEDHAGTSVLVLTTFDQDDILYGALRAGASGFMLKQAAPTSLADAVRQVAEGGSWIDPGVAGKVIDTLRETLPVDASGRPSLDMLSRRELEVLGHMADAPSNTELARRLFVSESTIKTHISRLLMKTGSHDRAQLVALAYRPGLVRP
ncbi:response regulator transcription factor [Ornithinimicrobium flavum]|uniref:response regulator transcription factor n=1 Tax=Ornithinimicrobium flavum TaxID=1288636 RepID=UPI0010703C0F|nr:response regulator transcription factor [Ornithinimicrobium flavum]